MEKGLPDEALRLASTAVDVFFSDGDKAGESRALQCVAQAMAWGATLQKSEIVGAPISADTGSSQAQDSLWLNSRNLEGTQPIGIEDSASSKAVTDFADLPMSYGERLIFETCLKTQGRPYDRERQEALARPRRHFDATAHGWGLNDKKESSTHSRSSGTAGGSAPSAGPSRDNPSLVDSKGETSSGQPTAERTLTAAQTDAMVARLSGAKRPKNSQRPPAEQIILRSPGCASRADAVDRMRKGGVDIASIVARLSTPRTLRAASPAPGERVVLMWNKSENMRKPDLDRLSQLAKSSRRGGTAAAWGVRPLTAEESQLSTFSSTFGCSAPHSAREQRYAAGTGAGAAQGASAQVEAEDGASLPPLGSPSRAAALEASLPPLDATSSSKSAMEDLSHTWSQPWRKGADQYTYSSAPGGSQVV